MNKSLALIPVIFAILALMVSPAMMSAYATQPENKPDACEERNPGVSKAVGNKHCDGGGSGPIETIDSECDFDENGDISAQDLVDVGRVSTTTSAQIAIDQAISDAGSKADENNVINNRTELRHLNHNLIDPC